MDLKNDCHTLTRPSSLPQTPEKLAKKPIQEKQNQCEENKNEKKKTLTEKQNQSENVWKFRNPRKDEENPNVFFEL